MVSFIQKIFLSPSKIAEKNQKQEIMQMVSSNPISHHSYATKRGGVARRFTIKNDDFHLYVERTYERFRPEENRVQYTLQLNTDKRITYAIHSDVDKFAEQVYNKIYKIWNKNKHNAK